MKKISVILLGICASFIFAGCPYESAVPIDQPTENISRLLLGTWTAKTPDGVEAFVVTKTDNFNYRITEKGDKSSATYSGYLSKVDNVLFLNVRDNKDANASFSFAKVDFNTNATKITLSFISDEVKDKFKSSSDLKAFIRKNISRSSFYEKDKLEFEKMSNE